MKTHRVALFFLVLISTFFSPYHSYGTESFDLKGDHSRTMLGEISTPNIIGKWQGTGRYIYSNGNVILVTLTAVIEKQSSTVFSGYAQFLGVRRFRITGVIRDQSIYATGKYTMIFGTLSEDQTQIIIHGHDVYNSNSFSLLLSK